MRRIRNTRTILFLIVTLAAVFPARAQWVEDGTVVAAYDGYQGEVHMVPDGDGGVIMAWTDHRNGAHDEVYAQRYDADGHALWTAGGVDVTEAFAVDQETPQVVLVGDGGVIVIYENNNMLDFNITAQRLDADGNTLWPIGGITICGAAGDQRYPKAIPDGSGGAIVAWEDERGGDDDVYVQRVDSNGVTQWAMNGILICGAANDQNGIGIVPDDGGGAIMTWIDHRAGTETDVYAQRVNHFGAVTWSGNGVPVCTATDYQWVWSIISDDAGGAIIAWTDHRGGGASDIYAQRVDAGGWMQWTSNGVAVCTAMNDQEYPVMTTDGAGGAIIAWADYRGTMIVHWNVYAQRLNASGAAQWTADGVAVCTAWNTQSDCAITSTPDGGAIIAWEDDRNGVQEDIFAQKLDADGSALWEANGIPVSDVVDMQVSPVLVEDGAGGAYVSWMDNRPYEYNWHVYILRIDYDGNWGYPSPVITGVEDVPHDQGGLVTVTWDASRLDAYPEQEITRYAVWRSLTGPPAYSWVLRAEIDAYAQGAYTYSDSTTADSTMGDPAYHYYKIIAHTSDPLVYWESNPDGGCSVDNTIPGPPTMLAGEQSFEPAGLILSWNPNPEPDISQYAVYRGPDEEFEPTVENRIAAPAEAGYFDAEWRWDNTFCYKVAALDINGNESDYAFLGSGSITGGETYSIPAATYLNRNFPNPFNPSTTISFGLHEPADVSLRIYDVSGRLIRTLINERREAGVYAIIWDGTDHCSDPVTSGVFFYRLRAGEFEKTGKMLLLR